MQDTSPMELGAIGNSSLLSSHGLIPEKLNSDVFSAHLRFMTLSLLPIVHENWVLDLPAKCVEYGAQEMRLEDYMYLFWLKKCTHSLRKLVLWMS